MYELRMQSDLFIEVENAENDKNMTTMKNIFHKRILKNDHLFFISLVKI